MVCQSTCPPGRLGNNSAAAGCGAWRSLAVWSLAAVCLAAGFLTGCSSSQPAGAPSIAETPPPAAERAPAVHPSPVPVVVSQPRPFRLDALADRPQRRPQPAAPIPLAEVPGAGRRPGPSGLVADDAGPVTLVGQERAVAFETPAAAAPPAEEGIRAALADYLAAFNRHDAPALAAHWTAAGTSVDLASGDATVGRTAVQGVFSALFAAEASASIDMRIESIHPVRDDVAVVDGMTRLSFAGGPPAASRFSAVMVREDGRWRLESMREAAAGRTPTPTDLHPLGGLAWLLGSWEDIGEGVTAGTRCFWSAGRGFLVRTHAVSVDERPPARPAPGDERIPGLLPTGPARSLEVTEIIGFDPNSREIRSWVFTSSGGFAEGRWMQEGSAWRVELEGGGRDTGKTCACILAPQGADGLSVSCDSDALADLLPPACEFVRTARSE